MHASRFWGHLGAGLSVAVACALAATADEMIFHPTDDAQVDQLSGGGWGDRSYISVRNRYGAGGSAYWEVDSLLRFDITSIPPGTEVSLATLHFYYYSWTDNNPAGRPLTCYRITSDWDEDTVGWNHRPTWLPPGQWTDSTRVPASFGWMEWDVTEDVQAFVDGTATDYGWCIMDETYWGYAGIPITTFRTKEHGDPTLWPYLTVVPEPGTLGLLLLGSLGILNRRR